MAPPKYDVPVCGVQGGGAEADRPPDFGSILRLWNSRGEMETVPRDRMGWQEGCRLGRIVKQVCPPNPGPIFIVHCSCSIVQKKNLYLQSLL